MTVTDLAKTAYEDDRLGPFLTLRQWRNQSRPSILRTKLKAVRFAVTCIGSFP